MFPALRKAGRQEKKQDVYRGIDVTVPYSPNAITVRAAFHSELVLPLCHTLTTTAAEQRRLELICHHDASTLRHLLEELRAHQRRGSSQGSLLVTITVRDDDLLLFRLVSSSRDPCNDVFHGTLLSDETLHPLLLHP